jgi:hypothetical protein
MKDKSPVELPFQLVQCTECEVQFCSRRGLRRHFQTYHGQKYMPASVRTGIIVPDVQRVPSALRGTMRTMTSSQRTETMELTLRLFTENTTAKVAKILGLRSRTILKRISKLNIRKRDIVLHGLVEKLESRNRKDSILMPPPPAPKRGHSTIILNES